MTSPRPYRDALPHETAMEELVSGKGTQFDPKVVDAFQKYYEKHKEVSYAPELLVDYRGYPIMLVGEDRDVLENVKSSLGKHLTIEIAENIQEALDILEEGKKIYLMIIFQRLSEIIKQEELNKIIEGGFPITKIAFHTMEHTMHYDEILSNCQVFKYIFNPSEPQALKMEIIKEIQHAIAKVGAANP
jgi:response regulator RpfG family c-di-GMP phosphodiesterase